MSMSMHVVGYMPADEQWIKMKSAWDACSAAGINPPDEVLDFFDESYPYDAPGKEVDLEGISAKKWSNECSSGYEIDVELLPKNIRIMRFYCSW